MVVGHHHEQVDSWIGGQGDSGQIGSQLLDASVSQDRHHLAVSMRGHEPGAAGHEHLVRVVQQRERFELLGRRVEREHSAEVLVLVRALGRHQDRAVAARRQPERKDRHRQADDVKVTRTHQLGPLVVGGPHLGARKRHCVAVTCSHCGAVKVVDLAPGARDDHPP